MDDNLSPEQNIKKLSKEQKIGVVLLLFFGVLAIGLGVLQIRNTIYAPLALSNAIPPDIKDAVNDPTVLKYRDTDGDGLSDFDELYVYSTSPYLKDSDSDGIDDKTEILQGTNPNCDEKKSACTNYLVNDTAADSVTSSTGSTLASGSIPDLVKDVQDPKKVRELILSSGAIDKKSLDQISDEVLMALVQQQTAASFQALGIPFTPVTSTVVSPSTTSSSTSPKR